MIDTLDIDLRPRDIQSLIGPDDVSAFFARLGYNTDARTTQTPGNLGITADGTTRQISRIELIADQESLFQVYLFELKSVTVAVTRAIARAFRNRAGNYLLVITSDYDYLDFVLLEKYLPSAQNKESTIAQKQIGIRPRVLTVERRKPTKVQLRVLRRLTWTELDPFAQYDKLISAYTIADWSEEFFNNRSLFSDYYLTERLPSSPVWSEDPKPTYKRLLDLYQGASSRLGGKPEALARKELLEPVLRELGFDLRLGKEAGRREGKHAFALYGANRDDSPLAFCLVYPWGRSLDGKDDLRDKESADENPAQVVVSILENADASWVIVTNGKLWRLYSKRTHSRSTNYYEIDVEEVLAQTGSSAADPANAFRYFWLLFRHQSFEPTTVIREGTEDSLSFLDVLLVESEDYAKELGERLKERVFEDVFPHLATGFIEHIRQNKEAPVEISSQLLDRVFQGTLTLLYRLLFLLYAESRDLLPVKETRGYFDVSLTKLKNETAIAAENIEDEVPEKLKRRYRTDSHALYDDLAELFKTIDRGNAALNVPFYNGGLFLSDPDPVDDTPEAEAARFLNQTKVSDRHLSIALDLLSRAEDNKSHALVFIDYKSLGVRQLGSIYEGLLEFKLHIAERKLAVVSEKGREVYVEFKELNQQKRDRAERLGRTVKKGDVYLENDKRERKATGSYYTPDYIVKHIVQHAVGPVIEEKFEAIRSSFREAQKWHKEAITSARARKESPAKYEFGPAVERKWQSLIDDFFDIKVLDPAMGSGHFLVEAVDLITDKALAFLNAFPWNPILAYLASTRETILREMEAQGISIDPKRLDDINLLKRHVLKRCIHGVDRNPMAVELAKVSLWLDCFTLGAPLSFLDHHLRCGNSLVGVGVEEARQAIESVTAINTRSKVAASPTEWKTLTSTKHQYDLFGGRFARLLKATELMRHVGEMSDVTSSQVRQSRSEYLNASSALQPFKRILDIYTSHWFGDEAKANSQSRKAKPAAIEFLKHADAEDVINAHGKKELECALIKLATKDRDLVGRALRVAHEQRFFHWELEFPEVFYGPTPGRPDAIEHLEDGGFDVVIGNPPFIDKKRIVRNLSELDSFWKECGQFSTAKGIYDVYMLFLEQAAKLCKRGGRFGLLTPIPWLTQTEGADIRKQIVKWGALELADFSSDSHFSDALVKVVAVIMKRGITSSSVTFRTNGDIRIQTEYIREKVFNGQLRLDVWPELIPILEKIYLNSVSLNTLYTPTFGLRACSKETGGFDKEFLIRRKEDCKNPVPYLEASDIRTQQLDWPGRWLDYQPELMYSPRSPELFLSPKILAPSLLGKRKIRAVYDDQGYFVDQSLVCISAAYDLPKILQNVYRPSLQATTLQLNSATISFYFAHAVVGEALGGGAIHATPGLIGKLRVFNQSSLERATAETVDGLIWDICELSDQERSVIIRWHADLEGGRNVILSRNHPAGY